MSVRLATTVLLVRGAHDDLEVFMVQRHRRSGFLPNAWVFPGGRVDPADHSPPPGALRGGRALLERLGGDPERARAFAMAGVRETWEEVGVWLGEGPPDAEHRLEVARGERRLTDVLPAHAAVDLDALRLWSWWVTPKIEPKRYDTRFLIARAEDADGSHDEHETVASCWVRPAEAAERAASDFPLAPPTWWTLVELARHRSAIEAFEAAEARPVHPIEPILSFDEQGVRLALPGHRDHPQPALDAIPTGITFDQGRWVAWRGDQRL